jgi:hypothetical protein
MMNFRRRETATLIERVRRVLREPRKLLEQWEVQLKQPEQLLGGNPEIAPQIPANHRTQSEEIGLRTVTARFSMRDEGQKTQTRPPEELGKRIRIVRNRQRSSRRLGRPRKNRKRKKEKDQSSRLPVFKTLE